jgi:hypothetical protein
MYAMYVELIIAERHWIYDCGFPFELGGSIRKTFLPGWALVYRTGVYLPTYVEFTVTFIKKMQRVFWVDFLQHDILDSLQPIEEKNENFDIFLQIKVQIL